MFHNYFFLKRLASSLHNQLKGWCLSECFSQNRNELVLGFSGGLRKFWIKANLNPNISLISFPETFHRANRNSINLFQEIVSQRVKEIRVLPYERSFEITFGNEYVLLFKMHASRSNILLVAQNQVHSIFRNILASDMEIIPSELCKHILVTQETFQEANYLPNRLIPALGKEVKHWWKDNCDYLDKTAKWNNFQKLLKTLEAQPIQLIENKIPKISLLPSKSTMETNDPLVAAHWLYDKVVFRYYFDREKTQLIHQMQRRIHQSKNYIFKTQEKLQLRRSERNPKEIANIIMANLHLIPPGQSKVALRDMDTSEIVEVPLNPKLTPQRNAENLYRKSKNRYKEINQLEEHIKEKENIIQNMEQEILKIKGISDYKELKKRIKNNGKRKKSKGKISYPYHEIWIDGWQILIGKNAKANDELTLKIARKNDLWLHAKDVSGSHVVIKQKPGQNYPVFIIEEAASYAAFYSKRKMEAVCPVIYTPKKYVRKAKGADSGQVIVDKKTIALVEPKEPKLRSLGNAP